MNYPALAVHGRREEVHHTMSELRPIERLLIEPTVPAELQRAAWPEYVELLTERMRRVQAEERVRQLVEGRP